MNIEAVHPCLAAWGSPVRRMRRCRAVDRAVTAGWARAGSEHRPSCRPALPPGLALLEQADNQDDSASPLRPPWATTPSSAARARPWPTPADSGRPAEEIGGAGPPGRAVPPGAVLHHLPAAQIADAACPLLEASLQQGFAAPAPAIAPGAGLQRQPAYRAALEAIPNMATVYAPYYPQPATRLACNRSRPQGLEMQWGASATTRPKCTACSATSTHSTA
jgi:hypothetical protein